MIIKSQLSARSEFYFACLGAKVNGWNLQISDKRTTHLSEHTKGGIESRRYRIRPVRRSVTEFSSKMRVFPGKKLSRFRGMKGINTHHVTLMVVSEF